MEFIAQYGLFLLKSITFVIASLVTFGGIFSISRKPKPKMSVTNLNKHFQDIKTKLSKELGLKKTKNKIPKKSKSQKPKLFVVDFDGDMRASQVESLREEVSAILTVADNQDEVVVRISSPGGTVNGYGLGASQLHRFHEHNIPLTACIDKVAASGGYLMACVAKQIIAAPFAIIGSIGVVAQLPNFHRWLQKNAIDVELLTAGEYKRTLTVFGENTANGRKKFQQDLEDIHTIFRQFVASNREGLDIDDVATGEHWLAKDALELNLIDKLQTSDEYIASKLDKFDAFKIEVHGKQSFLEKLLKPAAKLLHPFA